MTVETSCTAVVGWQPIETAPKQGNRLLYLARFDAAGRLQELDFDGVWEYWEESWELSHINGWYWASANGIEEPTHWAYQDQPLPPAVLVEPNLVVDLDVFQQHLDYRKLINSTALQNITWVKDGKVLEISDSALREWELIGLSNTDFARELLDPGNIVLVSI